MKIGKAIKTCRTRAGLSQSELSKKADVSQGYLANVEINNLIPSQKVLSRICNALKIPAPLLVIMATEYNDISHNKRKLYKELQPVLLELSERILNELYGAPEQA